MSMTLDVYWVRAFLAATTLLLAVAASGPIGTDSDRDTSQPSAEVEQSGPQEHERPRPSRSQRREDEHRAVPDPTGNRERAEQHHDIAPSGASIDQDEATVEPSGTTVDPAGAPDPSPGSDRADEPGPSDPPADQRDQHEGADGSVARRGSARPADDDGDRAAAGRRGADDERTTITHLDLHEPGSPLPDFLTGEYERWLRDRDGAPPAPSHGSPGPNHSDDITSGLGCAVQCITSGIAVAAPSSAWLEVTTTVPVHFWVSVRNDELGYAEEIVSKQSYHTLFIRQFDGLQPATTYQGWVIVQDANGNIAQASGSFTTPS